MHEHRHTVAVVDDDHAVLNALHRLLTASGYEVELYATTAEFIENVGITAAKCLVVDCDVGSDSGIQLVKQLSANGIHHQTIFLTASRDGSLRDQAIALGCVAFLQKPAASAQLLEAVRHAIRRADGR